MVFPKLKSDSKTLLALVLSVDRISDMSGTARATSCDTVVGVQSVPGKERLDVVW